MAFSLQGHPEFWLRVTGGQWLVALAFMLAGSMLAAENPIVPFGPSCPRPASRWRSPSWPPAPSKARSPLARPEPLATAVLGEGCDDALPHF